MPDEPAAAVSLHGLGDRLDRGLDRVHLVILREDLPGARAIGLEEEEVANQLEEARGREDAVDHQLELRAHPLRLRGAHRFPLGEVLGRRRQRADDGPHQVGDADDLDVAVELRDRLRVMRHLVHRLLRGIVDPGRLALDLAERQTVDVEQDVWAAVLSADDDRELVDGEELVVIRLVEIDQPGVVVALFPVLVAIRDGHAGEQELVEAPVVFDHGRRGRGQGQVAHSLHRVRRQVRVDARHGGAKPLDKHDVRPQLSLGRLRVGRQLGTVDVAPADSGAPRLTAEALKSRELHELPLGPRIDHESLRRNGHQATSSTSGSITAPGSAVSGTRISPEMSFGRRALRMLVRLSASISARSEWS